MSTQPPKLLAIALQKASQHPLLKTFEGLYVYGVLSQLARFTELQYKDRATVTDALSLGEGLPYDEALKKLQQLAQSSRTQYVFTGALAGVSPDGMALNEIKVTFRLYEAQGNRYVVDEVVTFRLTPDSSNPNALSNLPVANLNQLINLTTAHFARVIFPDDPHNQPGTAPFSASVQAMHLVLKAHQSLETSEKIALYESAIQADSQIETAYFHLARIYKGEQAYDQCVLHYRDTLKVSHASRRNKAVYTTEAGIACALMGRTDLALQWWMRAIEYDPGYINPYFNIANTYEDNNEFEKAEEYFLKAQHLAPQDFRTFFNLARIYSKIGAWEKALTQYHQQLKTEDEDPWCHSDVATCYLNLGDLQNARQHLEQTLALDPEGEAGQYAQLILSGLS